MVAVCSANQAPDVSIASALGSLLHVHRSIQSPYWRLQALVRLSPLFVRFGLSRQRLNREIRELAARVGTSARIIAPDRRTPSERFIALVDEIWEAGDPSRLATAERAFADLTKHHRPIGAAHLARLEVRFRSVEAALAHVQGIREPGRRSGALLVLVRGAVASGRLEVAREIADMISAAMMRERALLTIAEHLVARGEGMQAMKVLSRIAMPGLQAERFWLYALIRHRGPHPEIRLWRFFPDAMLRASVEDPAWVRVGEPRAPMATRVELLSAAFYVGLRRRFPNESFPVEAARIAGRHAVTPAARRQLVDLLGTDPDIVEAIETVGRFGKRHVADALLVEYVGQRARKLLGTEAPAVLCDGLAGKTTPSSDPRSIERALYDEGIALSGRARRRVLADAIRASLRAALVDPGSWDDDVIATRLRTLLHLGGELARDAIAKPLATLGVHSRFVGPAIETLAMLDADAAAKIVLSRACELGTAATDRGLEAIERHRGLPRGFASAYASARARVGDAFLVELVASWSARSVGPVPVLLLEALATRECASPQELFDELGGMVDELSRESHVELARRAANEPGFLELLQIAAPARVDPHIVPRRDASWPIVLGAASAKTTGVIDFAVVAECADLLGCDCLALARGDLGIAAVTCFTVENDEYRLVLLHKGRDLLTYLRFADVPVDTCYRTDGSDIYDDTTREATIEVWKDPLSFCLRIERGVKPAGFTFGNFIEIEGRIGVAFSGIYMRPNTPALRIEVVRAIERAVCAPLGITDICISTEYASDGPLPPEYVMRHDVPIRRLRALRVNGQLVNSAYDDISLVVNEPVNVSYLYWRRRRE